jgi:hypothetical protein
MKIKQLLDRANSGYPEGYLATYYNWKGQTRRGKGDTLAQFIVNELTETFDPDYDDKAQVEQATYVLGEAIKDLQGAINGLNQEIIK